LVFEQLCEMLLERLNASHTAGIPKMSISGQRGLTLARKIGWWIRNQTYIY